MTNKWIDSNTTGMASSTVKIVEDPNAPKEPDIIDLTSLDDEKEYDFG